VFFGDKFQNAGKVFGIWGILHTNRLQFDNMILLGY
jgi:hypothetical protein